MVPGRASASRGLFDAVDAAYGLAQVTDPRALEDSFNLNVVVRNGDQRLVVRAYRPSMTVTRLEAVQRVRQFLIDGGLPFAPLRRTLNGSGWLDFEGRLIEVEEFVPSETYLKTSEHLRLAMPILARVHNRLRLAPPDEAAATAPVANHLPAGRAVDAVATAMAALVRTELTAAEVRYATIAETLAHQLDRAEAPHVGGLPSQLVHGDFWDDNVRFTGTRISLITDLDFMGDRPRIDDLALTLFYANERWGRHDTGAERRARLRELVDAYDDALLSHLGTAERRALSYAIARTTLCFVADWVREPALANDVLAKRGPAWEWASAMIGDADWRAAFA